MTPEQMNMVDKYAEKLGTTATHLWEVLVAQAGIQAWLNLVAACLIAVACIAAIIVLCIAAKRDYDSDGDAFVPLGGVALIIFAGAFAGCSSLIETSITCFCNPEYWALQQIMHVIK